MRAPGEKHWNDVLARYITASGVPMRFDYGSNRFVGLRGHTILRLNPRALPEVWARMNDRFTGAEKDSPFPVIAFVTNKQHGPDVEDSYVILRLGTFMPMMAAMVAADRERWLGR